MQLHDKKAEEQRPPQREKNLFEELTKGGAVFILPVKENLDRYDWRIYNAVVDQLEHAGLGFDKGVIKSTGKPFLLALKVLLQYILPFDGHGVFKVRSIEPNGGCTAGASLS